MTSYPRLAPDSFAGAVLGGGLCAATAFAIQSPLLAAAGAGATVLVGALAAARVPGRRSMPAFVPVPLEFDAEPEPLADATDELREALARLRRAAD